MLTTVERVLFLQEIEIFKLTSTEDLAHIAAITDEILLEQDKDIFKEGDISDSLYLVIDGKVCLKKEEQIVMNAGPKDSFGTWALFDDEPRIVTATTLESTRLLRIDRDDFYELLSDHTRITQGLLKTLSKRLRILIEKVNLRTKST